MNDMLDGIPGRWVTPRCVQERRKGRFIRVPLAWGERLAEARYIATYRVALHVLYRHWRGGGEPFPLTNSAIKRVSRGQKGRALEELERLGLVAVERHKRKAPRITVLQTVT